MQDQIFFSHTSKQELVLEILSGIEKLFKESNQKDLLKNEWLTAKEVQTLLKITPVTLWNYDKKGLTHPQRVGNRKRYAKHQILEILTKKENRNSLR